MMYDLNFLFDIFNVVFVCEFLFGYGFVCVNFICVFVGVGVSYFKFVVVEFFI